eukprot:1958988-Heterocapsa_arctica.AAC.1
MSRKRHIGRVDAKVLEARQTELLVPGRMHTPVGCHCSRDNGRLSKLRYWMHSYAMIEQKWLRIIY